MKNHIKEAIYIIEQVRKTMPECTNKAFLQGALNELNQTLNDEETKKVEVVTIDKKCPECTDGYMRPTEVCQLSNPPSYPHKCNKCEYKETFVDKIYPHLGYL